MLNELKEEKVKKTMSKQNKSINKKTRKPKKKWKRNSGAEKNHNWNEKLTRVIQRWIRAVRRKKISVSMKIGQ